MLIYIGIRRTQYMLILNEDWDGKPRDGSREFPCTYNDARRIFEERKTVSEKFSKTCRGFYDLETIIRNLDDRITTEDVILKIKDCLRKVVHKGSLIASEANEIEREIGKQLYRCGVLHAVVDPVWTSNVVYVYPTLIHQRYVS